MRTFLQTTFWTAAFVALFAATAGPLDSDAKSLPRSLRSAENKITAGRASKIDDLAEALKSANERRGQLPCRVRRNSDGSYSFDREEAIGQLGFLTQIVCRRDSRGPVPRRIVRVLASRDDFEGSAFSWLIRPDEMGGSRLAYAPLIKGGETLAELEGKGALVSPEDLAQANGIAMRSYHDQLMEDELRTLQALRRQFGAAPRPRLRREL